MGRPARYFDIVLCRYYRSRLGEELVQDYEIERGGCIPPVHARFDGIATVMLKF
jgi:hypothetical protein